MRTKSKLASKSTEVANSQDICEDGCGIRLQHDLQSFGVPNVGPNVTTGNVGSIVSSVNVATLDVAGPWERTLENPTTLIFGKFIDMQQIPNSDFPKHYFNFAAYNELAARADVRNAILTDYISRIQAVSEIHTSVDVITNRTRRRIIDVQNLSGNTISLALWHEMTVNFNVREYEAMEKPVVIAVSPWLVRHNGLQLSGTSATHYYLSPNIPKNYQIKQLYQQSADTKPILNIDNQRYKDMEEKKNRNRFPLATWLQIDLQNYERVKFTSEATIYNIHTYKNGTTSGVRVAGNKSFQGIRSLRAKTMDHSQRQVSAIISDETATVSITCFSDHANSLTKYCNDLLAELEDKDPYRFPVFANANLALPAPSPQPTAPATTAIGQPQELQPSNLPAPLSQQIAPATLTPAEPQQVQPLKPLSPALSTTASNQPEIIEGNIDESQEPQSTPPQAQQPTDIQKEGEPPKLPRSSVRKALFHTDPQAESSHFAKRTKHEP
nr:hypothetical protein [Tanacetum cinerariifolium]